MADILPDSNYPYINTMLMNPDHAKYLEDHPVCQQIKELRQDDEYHSKMEIAEIFRIFFPASVKDMVPVPVQYNIHLLWAVIKRK
jgi:hypothetical protein